MFKSKWENAARSEHLFSLSIRRRQSWTRVNNCTSYHERIEEKVVLCPGTVNADAGSERMSWYLEARALCNEWGCPYSLLPLPFGFSLRQGLVIYPRLASSFLFQPPQCCWHVPPHPTNPSSLSHRPCDCVVSYFYKRTWLNLPAPWLEILPGKSRVLWGSAGDSGSGILPLSQDRISASAWLVIQSRELVL
jgi:hypothetical protein